MTRSTQLAAAFLLVAVAVAGVAPGVGAVEQDPQQHEVDATADITIESGANSAYLDLRYMFSPAGLDRNDEVVPILRRFVRHPTALWIGIKRNGSTIDTQTGAYAGANLELLGGRIYLGGQAGIEKDVVEYDPQEDGYWAATYHLELGARLAPLFSLGAYVDGRPVLDTTTDNTIIQPAYRDGGDLTIGGAMSFSTPNDRLFLRLSGGWRSVDWTFTGFHPGKTTFDGPVVGLHLDYQTSAILSFGFTLDLAREHWYDDRLGDDDLTWIGTDGDVCVPMGAQLVCHLERDVYRVTGTFDLIYWHKGRYGFRFSLGGGYASAAPLITDRNRGISKFGFGFISRF